MPGCSCGLRWAEAERIRKLAQTRKDGREKRPTPLRAEERLLFVSESGMPLRKGAFDDAWEDLTREAIDAKVITAEERFTLHGLKHRGVTDTKGTIDQKQEASGHRDRRMTQHYNHELAIVRAAEEPINLSGGGDDFSPDFPPGQKKGA